MNYPWQATVQDDQGNAVVNPVVTVWEADGVTLATIYDVVGAEIANPITGSLEGFVQFWASEGEYRIEGASGGEETEVWSWVAGPLGAIRYDVAQTLTAAEESQARTNIGAQPSGSYLRYDAQALTDPQQAQAASNIGAVVYGQPQSLAAPQQTQARGNIGAGVPAFTGTFNTIDTAAGIIHYNTSDRPMFVGAITPTASATSWMRLYVRATASNAWYEASVGYDANHASVYGIVPSGWQYKLEGVPTVISMRTHH